MTNYCLRGSSTDFFNENIYTPRCSHNDSDLQIHTRRSWQRALTRFSFFNFTLKKKQWKI